jgi:drug/metabolite transporter (DMT)-like permease
MNRPTIARFLGQAAIWGSSFALIKIALNDISPSQLVLGRLILGAAVLAAFALMTKVSLKMCGRAWTHVAISAVFANVAPYLLLSYGEQHASAGVAGVLIGGTPLVTLLIATLTLREERANRRSVAGFVIGFIGVVLVLSPWAAGNNSVVGSVACFGAAVSYAVGYVYVRKFLSPLRIKPVTLATNQLIAAERVLGLVATLHQDLECEDGQTRTQKKPEPRRRVLGVDSCRGRTDRCGKARGDRANNRSQVAFATWWDCPAPAC